jgi:sugar/nucleoside kinase (ribokinase family)
VRGHVNVLAGDVSGRRSNLRAMRHTDLLAPSEAELRDATRMYDEGLPLVTWRLLEETRGKAAIITMGADGLLGFSRLPKPEGQPGSWQTRLKGEHVPALCPLAVDPLGCGDALLAAATLSLLAGGSMLAASFIGACAAGTQVQRLGNTAVSATDLRQMITRVHGAHLAYAAPEVVEGRRAVG